MFLSLASHISLVANVITEWGPPVSMPVLKPALGNLELLQSDRYSTTTDLVSCMLAMENSICSVTTENSELLTAFALVHTPFRT